MTIFTVSVVQQSLWAAISVAGKEQLFHKETIKCFYKFYFGMICKCLLPASRLSCTKPLCILAFRQTLPSFYGRTDGK